MAAEPAAGSVRDFARCVAALTPLARGANVAATDAVVVESRGVALVVGDDAGVAAHAAALLPALKVVLCAPGALDAADLPSGVIAVGGRIVGVSGRLGAFTACAATGSTESADIGGFSPNPDRSFDLVLDLSRSPHLKHEIPPLGYFAPGPDPAAIAAAITTMRALVGRFAKPRYFDYAPALCTHGAQGKAGCTRCLDVCAAAAIRSLGDIVAVDPYLCQGCASCSLACPTGALSYRQPTRADLVSALAQTITAARGAGVARPILVVHTPRMADAVRAVGLPLMARALEVPALPAFGEELWLAAIAQGAGAVVLVQDDGELPTTRKLIETRVRLAGTLTVAVGAGPARILLASGAELKAAVNSAIVATTGAHSRTTSLNAKAAKRPLLMAALDTLAAGAVADPVALLAGAPFGTVVVDRERCTLCHACVNLCPTSALIAGNGTTPTLSLVEVNCVQCGICVNGCPEAAVVLEPRFVPDARARNGARQLNEDELAPCTSCGTPFIGRRMLAASLAKMRDFPGLANAGGVERLRMCPACRQRGGMDAGSGG